MKSKTLTCVVTIVAMTIFAPLLFADLGSAKSFAVLSSTAGVTFQNRDSVTKISTQGAVTCPDAAGCLMRIGGKTVAMGRGNSTGADQIGGDVIASATAKQGLNCSGLKPGTTAICLGNITSISGKCVAGGGGVSNPSACAGGVDTSGTNPEVATLLPKAGPDAAAFSAFLAALTATQTLAAINLASGGSQTITADAGLNVIAVPSIVIGSGGTLTVSGTSNAQVVINIGSVSAPGTLTLNLSAKVLLSGGITPDKVVFNVQGGGGRFVQLGNTITFNGTILAPQQGLVLIDGSTSQPTTINGALLFGLSVSIGNNVAVNFYPLAQIVMLVTGSVTTIDVTQLPPPITGSGTSSESDADNPEPVIENAPPPPSSQLSASLSLTRSPAKTAAAAVITGPTNSRGVPRLLNTSLTQDAPVSADPLHASPVVVGLGNTAGHVPPDTQLAAGQNSIVEMVNTAVGVYNKSGNLLSFRNVNNQLVSAIFDVGSWFGTNRGQGTDPRVLYDAGSQHFFGAYELKSTGGDTIVLGLAGDPTIVNGVLQPWNWNLVTIKTNNVGICFDQPKLGFSDDKVMLSWNDYSNDAACTDHNAPFAGAEYVVIDKASLFTNTPRWRNFGPDSNRFQIVPVQSLTGTTVQYAAYHPLSGFVTQALTTTIFKVMAFTGDVANGVDFTEQSYTIRRTPVAPDARQPTGGNPSLDTGDTRLLTAVWENDNLWGTMNEGCIPLLDTTMRSCGRVVKVSTASSSLLEDRDLEIEPDSNGVGVDLYYPAVIVNGHGDVFFGFTVSSANRNPSAGVSGAPGGDLNKISDAGNAIVYQPGTAVYSVRDGTKFTNRWGDYSGAVVDPTDPNVVWLAQEYSTGDWGTAIARVFFGP